MHAAAKNKNDVIVQVEKFIIIRNQFNLLFPPFFPFRNRCPVLSKYIHVIINLMQNFNWV